MSKAASALRETTRNTLWSQKLVGTRENQRRTSKTFKFSGGMDRPTNRSPQPRPPPILNPLDPQKPLLMRLVLLLAWASLSFLPLLSQGLIGSPPPPFFNDYQKLLADVWLGCPVRLELLCRFHQSKRRMRECECTRVYSYDTMCGIISNYNNECYHFYGKLMLWFACWI